MGNRGQGMDLNPQGELIRLANATGYRISEIVPILTERYGAEVLECAESLRQIRCWYARRENLPKKIPLEIDNTLDVAFADFLSPSDVVTVGQLFDVLSAVAKTEPRLKDSMLFMAREQSDID